MSAESITLRSLACPACGTILEPRIHGNGDGTVRCPVCKRNCELYEADRV